jgi:uncharacterized membrane protein
MASDKIGSTRPVPQLRRSTFDWVMEALAAAALIYGVILLIPYGDIPDRIPRHFGASGEADAWGDKSLLLWLMALSAVLYAGLTVLNRFPHIFNYPWNITDENAARQYGLARSLMNAIKACVTWIFTYIVYGTLETAYGNAQGLGSGFLPIILTGTFVPIAAYLFLAYRSR